MYLSGGARIQGVQIPFQPLNNTDNPVTLQSDEGSLSDQANEISQRDFPEVSVHSFVDVSVERKPIDIVENREEDVASKQFMEETPAILETGQPPMNVLVHLTHVNLSEMNISVLEEGMYHSTPGLEHSGWMETDLHRFQTQWVNGKCYKI
ncbi:hypothetical protein G6F56_005835 [Rhizopus delemar]|nr:hypothetical protein G6F56_005835 [Rhizopus delemar]